MLIGEPGTTGTHGVGVNGVSQRSQQMAPLNCGREIMSGGLRSDMLGGLSFPKTNHPSPGRTNPRHPIYAISRCCDIPINSEESVVFFVPRLLYVESTDISEILFPIFLTYEV